MNKGNKLSALKGSALATSVAMIVFCSGCISEELQREMHLKKAHLHELNAKYLRLDAEEKDYQAGYERRKGAGLEKRLSGLKSIIKSREKFVPLVQFNRPVKVAVPLPPEPAMHSEQAPENKTFKLPNGATITLIGIGAGSFVMGTPMPEDDILFLHDVGHKVTLTDPFWIGKYEITQGQYDAVMGGERYKVGLKKGMKGSSLPVFDLTWEEADAFARKLNELLSSSIPEGYHFDIPTEAQWEYACRAGTTTAFNTGMDIQPTVYPATDEHGVSREVRIHDWQSDGCKKYADIMWLPTNSSNVVHEVGLKTPNKWGVYDMHGNVDEWCKDWFAEYDGANMINPIGPSTGDRHVIRGGNFIGGVECIRDYTSSGRGRCLKDWHNYKNPFRNSTDTGLRDMDASVRAGLRIVLTKEMHQEIDRKDSGVYGRRVLFQGGDDVNNRIKAAYLQMCDEQRNASKEFSEGIMDMLSNIYDLQDFLEKMALRKEAVAVEIRQAAIEAEIAAEKAEKNRREAEVWQKIAFEAMDIILPAIQAGLESTMDHYIATQGNVVSVGGAASGFGTINGAGSLTYTSSTRNGQWSRYSLYVGGKNVTNQATWSAGGTAITVSSGGRAMAGNPPCSRGGSFRSGIKATYNGKTYTKSITIFKR